MNPLITQTLTVFFSVVLTKRFTSPSSDIIEVTSGLDNVDAVYLDLTATLESTIKNGRDGTFHDPSTERFCTNNISLHETESHQSRNCCCRRWLSNSTCFIFCPPRPVSSAYEGNWIDALLLNDRELSQKTAHPGDGPSTQSF
jgi:hypothetical protein